MSYILDALKKAQKQRRRGSVPDVLTVQEIVVQQPSARLLWPMVAACGAVLAVMAIIWYVSWRGQGGIRPEASVQKPAPEGTVTARELPRADIPAVEGPANASGPPSGASHVGGGSISAPAHGTRTPSGGITPRVPEKVAATADVVPDAMGKAEEVRGAGDTPARSADRQAGQLPPAEHRIYALKDVPDAVRKALPDFNITALMYSRDPASRMVRINGRLMREGEHIPQGIRLDEITPEGVILAYQGYRFIVALK